MYDEEWFQGRDDDTYDSTIRYDSYDTHLCIGRFMSTYNIPLRYETFYTRYNTHVSYNTVARVSG